MIFEDVLEKRLAEWKKEKAKLEVQAEFMPGTTLLARSCHGKKQYFLVKEGKEKYTGDQQLAERLINKEYARKVLPLLTKLVKYGEKLKVLDWPNGRDRIVGRMQKIKQENLVLYKKTKSAQIAAWEAQEYQPNTYPYPGEIHTRRGDLVRSKSELIIADSLYAAGIPYHYEKPLKVGESVVYPDFTILNPRTMEEFYWEHQGKMGDEKYAPDAIKKQDQYIKHGIMPGVNLIITQECSQQPLAIETVDAYIERLLL